MGFLTRFIASGIDDGVDNCVTIPNGPLDDPSGQLQADADADGAANAE